MIGGYEVCMGVTKFAYKILVVKPEGKRLHGRPALVERIIYECIISILILMFVCHIPIRLAWGTCNKTATAEKISSFILNQMRLTTV
jgi:hypothetical protein